MSPEQSSASRRGFSLVEIMVSMTIVTLILLVLVSLTDSVRRTWSYTTTKTEQFRDAREAFESVTRRLSQATLNTYLDYDYPLTGSGKADTTQLPSRYARQSELRFISGTAQTLIASGSSATHAVFFQAPIGYSDKSDYADLQKLLNTCGYFIEFGDDTATRPTFITTAIVPPRYRFRLMEMVEPSESLTLYKYTSGYPGYTGTDWFTVPLGLASRPAQVRAENIIALIILPKLAAEEDSTGAKLAPAYSYDSTLTAADATLNSKNQLPPVVQITMVAVDETSFSRYQKNSTMTDLTSGLFTDATQYDSDLSRLQTILQDKKLNYRVFTTNVSLKNAKWSREQSN
ncbi:MAG: Verru_Chthon cassette protein C [Chthoniobacteraceae bacterium]